MKRSELIEWGIVVIALIFGYKFIEALLSLIIQIVYGFDRPGFTLDIFRFLPIIALYAVVFIALITRSDKIGTYFSRADNANNEIHIKIGKRSMLQVILIAICISTILSNVAEVIYYLFDAFRRDVHTRAITDQFENGDTPPSTYSFVVNLIRIVIAIIVIYFSKNIADQMIRKNEADELVFDSNTQIDQNQQK